MTELRSVMTAGLEDGTFIAVSPFKPRFCVGGATIDEAMRKAEAAFAFYDSSARPVPDPDPEKSRSSLRKPDFTVSRLQS